MKKIVFILCPFFILLGCNSNNKKSNQPENPGLVLIPRSILVSKFEQVSPEEIVASQFYKTYNSENKDAPFGDFMSRIWDNYGENLESIGKPQEKKGDTYAFKHRETGIVFSAYPGGLGPSFGGFDKDRDELENIISEFEELLAISDNADCEFTLLVDDGKFKIGAKSGQAFDLLVPYD